ncbi:MAG: type II secretion system F family protein [Sedimentisphaerales bacterium]|jgi:type II secretory pathway component PulF|nr:type II secretion system F family protein [Sedimentisphaerales bacterium]HNY77148.1 type II secretion system F family protein [Sedimentisphaerales bacterium]HOC62436.1 type II secretion system F family protein [Sedimentisphaerales bacterium]HOH62954.1 type II secretion system F family protein [Sedimentisphaerales bacterium]HPY50080.1 type II secretion system F family protein [Sedimentisphaerales bacterium]
MATFTYKAIDATGRETVDKLVAADRASAIEQIYGRKLCPVSVEKAEEVRSQGWLSRVGGVSKREIDAFTRQLANLLAAGVPMSRALGILSREASRTASKKLWATVHDQVSGGMPLADALSLHPSAFSPIYVAMVRAGETGGFLDIVLEQIATFRAREADLKGRVKGALVYPIILAVLSAGIMVFLLMFFIPRFSQMFEEFGGSLPALTRYIVAASDLLAKYWFVLVIGIILIIFGVQRMLTKEEGRRTMEGLLLRVPLFGTGVARFALVRFCRMLGTLVGAGVPLIASLRVAKEAIGNQVLADTVSSATENVQKGQPLARSLEGCRVLFPPAVIEMVSVAEESGRLDKELVRLAGAYEADLDRHLKMMVTLIEPALLFLMAVLVGTVVIGMLLPIFNLQELIR